jgi:hypothetical protein
MVILYTGLAAYHAEQVGITASLDGLGRHSMQAAVVEWGEVADNAA